MWEFLVTSMNTESYTALQVSQRAVTADSKTKHLLLFGFARQFIDSLHAYLHADIYFFLEQVGPAPQKEIRWLHLNLFAMACFFHVRCFLVSDLFRMEQDLDIDLPLFALTGAR